MIRKKIIFILLIISAVTRVFAYEKLWGVEQGDFINTLPTSAEYFIFRPEEKPDYKNRVLAFFNAMGGSGTSVIVLRIQGKPEKDYCFFNDRLYSVSEDWGSISLSQSESLINNFKTRYKFHSSDTRESTTTITFEKDRTKIIIYRKPVGVNEIKFRIFFYSNDIFSILLKD